MDGSEFGVQGKTIHLSFFVLKLKAYIEMVLVPLHLNYGQQNGPGNIS